MRATIHERLAALAQLGLAWPDRASVAATLGRPWSAEERRSWAHLVRSAYAHLALGAGLAMFGRALSVEDVAHIERHSERWAARVREAAGLAPLLAAFVRVRDQAPADLAGLRSGALRKGLTPQAWKWLRRQPRATVARLFAFGWTPESVCWANLLARALPHRPLTAGWLEPGRPYMGARLYDAMLNAGRTQASTAHALNLERFFRLLPEPNAQALTQYEILVSGLVLGSQDERYALRANPGCTWTSLLGRLRRHNEQREALARQHAALDEQAARGEPLVWPKQFGCTGHRGVVVRELCSDAELREEGVLMDHCVGDGAYTGDCAKGVQVVFSLLEPVTRQRATLQLRQRPGRWYIAQLAGIGNTNVPSVFWQVARDIASGQFDTPCAAQPLAA